MKILLIGCGHMGGAMLAGWRKQPDVARIDVVDPSSKRPETSGNVTVHATLKTLTSVPDITVLAVKPQNIDEACASLAPHLSVQIPVLSIAAGVTLTKLARLLGANRPLVRAMPNMPGAIGEGITVFTNNDNINKKQLDMMHSLLSTLGSVSVVNDESLMDAVTAVSGSGPAYIFFLTEALENAGKKAGLPEDLAAKLARQTVIGAAALLKAESDKAPESLRKAVTSPGGTTAAALDILSRNRALEILMDEAVSAAAQRSKDLSGSQ